MTELDFTGDAGGAIAEEAMKRKTGACALGSIVEEIMMDIMFEAPSRSDLKKVMVTKDLVEKRSASALLVMGDNDQVKKAPKGEMA